MFAREKFLFTICLEKTFPFGSFSKKRRFSSLTPESSSTQFERSQEELSFLKIKTNDYLHQLSSQNIKAAQTFESNFNFQLSKDSRRPCFNFS